MQLAEFLKTVITTPEGHFCLAHSTYQDDKLVWREHWFQWPQDINEIIYKVNNLREHGNVYFSAHLFKSPQSTKENVLPTKTIQADLDHADVFSLAIQPTVVVQTSAERYQAFWVLREDQDLDIIENLSRKLAYAIPYCDKTGWPLGHKFRLPHTYNFKYPEPFGIKIAQVSAKRYDKEKFDVLPDLETQQLEDDVADREWINLPHTQLDIPPLSLVNELRQEGKLSLSAFNKYRSATSDRSAALWQLMCECLNAGIGRDLTYWIAYNSANNKFADNRYNATRDLRKDVLRAEYKVHYHQLDIKQAIIDVRKSKQIGSMHEKLTQIYNMVLGNLRNTGTFHHTTDGSLWFVPNNTGRPIHLSRYSDWLQTLLTFEYGLNSATTDFQHVVSNIIAQVRSMPQDTEINLLSFYEKSTNSLMIHSGGRDIYVVTPTSVSTASNGQHSILFRYASRQEFFKPDYDTPLTGEWHEVLFDGSLETLTNLSKKQAKALLIAWFMMILFRNACFTRPIVAVFGPPGSGKSTLMRLVYRVIYGRGKDLSQIGRPEDFDIETSAAPLVCYDNTDTWDRWLPDRLALATTVSEVTRRKLYSDTDVVRIKRDTVLSLTAHSPKFVREDIADRLLVINLSRRGEFADEAEILQEITRQRNALWAAIIRDVQKILATPYPESNESPQFRIKDFATFGLWVTRALGIEQDFRDAIKLIQRGQQDLVIAEELLLVGAIDRLVKSESPDKGWHITDLFTKLQNLSGDPIAFQRTYKSAILLSKKLPIMTEALKAHFDVKWSIDRNTGTRVWNFARKVNDDGTA